MVSSGIASVTLGRMDAPSTDHLVQWDRLVESTLGTDVTQLSRWATIRATVGYRPTYLLAYHGDMLVGGALVLRRRLFGVLGVGYVSYGPLISASAPDRTVVRAVLVDALIELAAELSLTFVQPPEHADDVRAALLAGGFRPSVAGIAPIGSYRLDLTPEVEQIRARFSKRLKSWPNRWASKGVAVRQGDERDLPLLIELMTRSGTRQGFTPPSLDYVTTLYSELARGGNAASCRTRCRSSAA